AASISAAAGGLPPTVSAKKDLQSTSFAPLQAGYERIESGFLRRTFQRFRIARSPPPRQSVLMQSTIAQRRRLTKTERFLASPILNERRDIAAGPDRLRGRKLGGWIF